MGTADWYRHFATVEAAGSSPMYEGLALAVADDEGLLARLDALPPAKRQPNLLLAASRLLGAPLGDPAETLAFIGDRWPDVRAVMLERSTQTNEAARAATILAAIAHLDGPVALIEVGASAGLCLYPDRFCIRYGDRPPVGPASSSVQLDVATTGPVPVPSQMPEVVWRAGIDRNPLDVRDPDDLAWLSACIWPEHDERRERLVAAAGIVAADPPHLVAGDLVETIDGLLDAVPDGATPVVFHSAVLAYVDPAGRAEFARKVRAHPSAVWVSNEAPGVVDGLHTDLSPPEAGSAACFVVGTGGSRVLGISDPHGSWLRWREGSW